MSFLRRRQPPWPQRDPHPDPRVEAVLQRVMSLQATIARKEAAADQAMLESARAARAARGSSGSSTGRYLKTASELREAAVALEAEITVLHDEIAKRLDGLGDEALFLVIAPVRTRPRARGES